MKTRDNIGLSILVICGALTGCSAAVVPAARFDEAHAIGGNYAAGPRHVVGVPYYRYGRLVRPRHQPEYTAIGRASWYGPEQDGRRTANGEIVDSTNLFAAHPTLPLPSYVSIENIETGITYTVRVNDRDPVPPRSMIGVSERTADLLGLKANPSARVRVRYLSPAPIEYIGRR